MPEHYLVPVGQGRRFANYLIDLVSIVSIAVFIGLLCALLGFTSFIDSLDNSLMERVVGLVLSFVYYLFFEALFGRTIGKMVTGTRVVMEDGSTPSFSAILKRTLWRCVPFDGLTFLGNARGWHDEKSDTMVIRAVQG